MSRSLAPHLRPRLLGAVLLGALVLACDPVTQPAGNPDGASLARGSGGPTVTAALPSYAHQGDAGIEVRILGSGFDQGSVASWERDGAVDPKVTVHGTRFISSSEVAATISVASDASIDLYDVAVTTSTRKKGIGMERFTVTVAQSIGTLGGNTLARAVNDEGATVGYSIVGGSSQHAFFAGPGAAMQDLGSGQAYDLDATGTTVVGWRGGEAVVWKATGSSWISSRLPDNGAGSRPTAIATTASGLLIGGAVNVPVARNRTSGRAALWRPSGTGWTLQLYPLPPGTSGAGIEDVNENGQAVGSASNPYSQPYFYDGNGVATQLPLLPGDQEGWANGIDPSGTTIAGQSGSGAAYWKKNAAGQWVANVLESCGRAIEVNRRGMIVGWGCESQATLWVLNADGTVIRKLLVGLGGTTEDPGVEGINNAELPQAAGTGKQQSSSTREGVIWNLNMGPGM